MAKTLSLCCLPRHIPGSVKLPGDAYPPNNNRNSKHSKLSTRSPNNRGVGFTGSQDDMRSAQGDTRSAQDDMKCAKGDGAVSGGQKGLLGGRGSFSEDGPRRRIRPVNRRWQAVRPAYREPHVLHALRLRRGARCWCRCRCRTGTRHPDGPRGTARSSRSVPAGVPE